MSFRSARFAALAAVAAAASHLALAQSEGLEEIVVTADFREARIEELPVSVTRARSRRAPGDDAAAFRGSDPQRPELEPLRRGLARALLPAARRRRARAVRRRAEPVDRFHRRRHRLLGARQHRHAVRHRSRRGAARPARHALRRERARRARLHALAGAARLRLSADVEATAGSDGTRRARRGLRRPARRRRSGSERPCRPTRTTVSATTFSWAATTPTAATS